MEMEKLKNQLKSQRGVTAADAVVAMLIILTTVGVIAMVYVNLNINSREIDRKAGATRIVTNIIENMNKIYYSEIGTILNQLSDTGVAVKVDDVYTIPGTDTAKVFNTSIPRGYTCKISIENPNLDYDIIKKINVTITYKVDNQEKDVTLSKVMEKEVVRECNSPQFSEEYVRQMVESGKDYVMASSTADSIQNGIKIICPVRYNKEDDVYQLVDVSDNLIWYQYSNKNWARVLVLENEDYNMYIDHETGHVLEKEILQDSEKSYVWIPRFGIEKGGDLFGNTYFKYKKTNLPILNSFYDEADMTNYYVDMTRAFDWGTRGISFETDTNLTGKWVLYESLNNTGTDGYYLNHSQYGPMIDY